MRRPRGGALVLSLAALPAALVAAVACGSGRQGGATPDADVPTTTADAGATTDDGAAPVCSPSLTNDPKNCGRCGHDCLGGGCREGQCLPVALAVDQATPQNLHVVDGVAYWGSEDGLFSVPVSGGSPTQLVKGITTRFAVDASDVYYASQSAILRIPKAGLADGGAPATVTSTSAPEQIQSIVGLDGVSVWFVTFDAASGAFPIRRAPTGGGASEVVVANGGFSTWVDAVDAFVYWAPNAPGLRRSAKSPETDGGTDGGGDPDLLAGAAATTVYSLTADATRIYAVTVGSALVAVPRAGGPVTTIIEGERMPGFMVVDRTTAYFTDFYDGSVRSCPLTGCAPGASRVLATNQARPDAIAIDDTAVYWTTQFGGEVLRLAK